MKVLTQSIIVYVYAFIGISIVFLLTENGFILSKVFMVTNITIFVSIMMSVGVFLLFGYILPWIDEVF